VGAQPRLEAGIDHAAGLDAAPIRAHEHRMPASGPAEPRSRALHVGAAFGCGLVVGRCHRARLGAERLGRIAPRGFDVLRIDAAEGRHRIDDRLEHATGCSDHMRDRFRADIALGAVADAVGGTERGARLRTPSVAPVTEAQPSLSCIVDLDHEMPVAIEAVEQVLPGEPVVLRAGRGARCVPGQRDQRHRIAWMKLAQGGRGPCQVAMPLPFPIRQQTLE
jgi:hypothetical protein